MKKFQFLLKSTAILIAFCFLTSCVSTSESVYFSKTKSSEYKTALENLEPRIQKNDLLHVTITSLNPQATEIFNVYNANNLRSTNASNTIAPVTGYLVDQDGNIQIPLLGNVRAVGLTKKELKNNIERELERRQLLVEPTVDIRYLNYKVSVLGEVARPTVITVPNEKLTLLEALGLAGDLTIYASRNNLLLIREESGSRKLIRIDLTSDELFTSPYYHLKSNDIIYVEPNKTKIASAGPVRQWLPLVLSSLTLVVVSIDRLTR